jgi:phosphatidylglycerophosphatase C
MGYRFGGLVPRFLLPRQAQAAARAPDPEAALTLSDSLHDLPLLALGEQAWLINPTRTRLLKARAVLPHIEPRYWSL